MGRWTGEERMVFVWCFRWHLRQADPDTVNAFLIRTGRETEHRTTSPGDTSILGCPRTLNRCPVPGGGCRDNRRSGLCAFLRLQRYSGSNRKG